MHDMENHLDHAEYLIHTAICIIIVALDAESLIGLLRK